MKNRVVRRASLLVALSLGCGEAGPWSSSSVELRLHTLQVFDSIGLGTAPPGDMVTCVRFPRAAMSSSQLGVLAQARLTLEKEPCTLDGCEEVSAELLDADGGSATFPVHGSGCDCMHARSGLPRTVADAFASASASACP